MSGRGRRRVAFYAPMKPPDHPSPSGDRAMARLLMHALEGLGHEVTLVSRFRSYLRDPEDTGSRDRILSESDAERARIKEMWREVPPDLWVCYHPYYKSPDLIGPDLCRDFGVPWVTVEASLSARRSRGHWAGFQDRVLDTLRGARVNLAMTERDAVGLHEIDPDLVVERLGPFTDVRPLLEVDHKPERNHLVTVAMMRPGDKLESYRILADALRRLLDLGWHLTVAGDGPARSQVEALFAGLPDGQVTWAGELDPSGVAGVLARGSVFVWPGVGEAFGLAYLEAQAVGLPVVAQNVAGVPEVVRDGKTGVLTEVGDLEAYANAIRRLVTDADLLQSMSSAARKRVRELHSLEGAAQRLGAVLDHHVWKA